MNIFQDKKNLPWIIGVVVLVLAGAGGAAFYFMNAQSPAPVATAPVAPSVPTGRPAVATGTAPGAGTASPPTAPARVAAAKPLVPKPLLKPGVPAKQPAKIAALPHGLPAKPGAAKPGAKVTTGPAPAGQPAKATAQAAKPTDVASGPDPFRLATVAAPVVQAAPVDFPQVPDPFLSNWHPTVHAPAPPTGPSGPLGQVTVSDGSRRMAGVLFGDGVYAILETNGKTEAVQPGDTVEGGKVLSIEADGLTLKTDDDRIIKVPLSSTPTGGEAPSGNPGEGAPPPGFGAPGNGNGPPPGRRPPGYRGPA